MQDFNGTSVCIEHLLYLSVYKRAFICAATAKFDTEIANSLMHLVRLYCTARSFSFASFPCSLCPAHNSSCPVYGTVKRITTLFGIHSLQNYRNVSHTPADKTFLPWCSWRGSFTHNDIFFSAMNFFPSIIMMVVDFFHSFCA